MVGRFDGRRAGQQPGEVGVETVVHHVHRCARSDGLEVLTVGVGARDHELRSAHLASQQTAWVLIGLVDVFGVAGERERQVEQMRGPPGDGDRAMGEVGMDVGDRIAT
jgi:hypothetical protein